MFLRLHTLYISTILLLKLMFLSFVKNKFSLSNYIMAILVNKTVAREFTHHSVNNDVFVPRNKTKSSVICSLLLLLASITMI